MKCEKCGCELPIMREASKLCGERYVYLCLQCLNKWYERFTGDVLFKEVARIEALRACYTARAVSGREVPLELWMELTECKNAVQAKLWQLSGEWLGETNIPADITCSDSVRVKNATKELCASVCRSVAAACRARGVVASEGWRRGCLACNDAIRDSIKREDA